MCVWNTDILSILILFILEKDYYQCHILGFCPIFCSFVDIDHIGLPADKPGFLVDFKTESFGTNWMSLGIIMGNHISFCLRFKTFPNCECIQYIFFLIYQVIKQLSGINPKLKKNFSELLLLFNFVCFKHQGSPLRIILLSGIWGSLLKPTCGYAWWSLVLNPW